MSSNENVPEVSKVHIACAFDDAYAPHFVTLAASLAASRGSELLHISIVTGPELTDSVINRIERYLDTLDISVEFIRISDIVHESLPRTKLYPALVWYRLLLPELLPSCNKVLYLDTDTLVLQSLLPLYMQELGTNLVGAVATPMSSPEQQRHFERIGIGRKQGYINTGVLLMNLQLMREEKFGERAIKIGRDMGALLTFPDQDAINFLAMERWKMLHPKWNAMSYLWLYPRITGDSYSMLEYAVATHSPSIVHFEGPHTVKPWYFRSAHPMRMLYRQFRAETPWPLKELEGRSLTTAALRVLPLKLQYFISDCKTKVLSMVRTQKI
jgi:lipopolysaccharide biosynthesis glycosyltransferase